MKKVLYLLSICLLFGTIKSQAKVKDSTKGEFTIVPYFDYNTTKKFGLGLVPLYTFKLHKSDSLSPKSYIGGAAVYRTTGAFAVVTYGSLFFKEDRWRFMYSFGLNDNHFQTFVDLPSLGTGLFIDYNTKGNFAYVNLRRKVYEKLFLGMGYSYGNMKTHFEQLGIDSNTKISVLGLDAYRDNRDLVYYPKSGSQFLLRWNILPTFLGNQDDQSLLIAYYNKYIAVKGGRDVIAARFNTKAALTEVSFQQQSILGGKDLRGYTQGKYRGDGVIDVQGEYRWNFENPYNLGLVGFAGLGTIYGSSTPSFDWQLYPSIGAGIRYTAVKSTHMNVGVDFGIGKDDWGIYFRLNEAF